MDWPFLHVATNHIPITGIPLFLVLLVIGLLRRSRDLVRAALVGTVILAAMTRLTVQTGHQAEHALEDAETGWLDEAYVHQHEERAETTGWVAVAAGVAGLLGLWLTRGGRPVASPVPWATAALLAVTSGLLLWTAFAGGLIRHEEFRSGAPPPAVDEGHTH